MGKGIIIGIIIGAVIGHFGPVYVGKMTLHGTSVILSSGAKVLDTANKIVK